MFTAVRPNKLQREKIMITQTQMDSVMTLRETAEYLRLSEMTVLRLIQKGVIPGIKIGRQWRFSKDSIVNFVNRS